MGYLAGSMRLNNKYLRPFGGFKSQHELQIQKASSNPCALRAENSKDRQPTF